MDEDLFCKKLKLLLIIIVVFLFFRVNGQKNPLNILSSGIIAYSITSQTDTNQIFIINHDGSDKRQISHVTGRACGPDWSPDGSKIAFYNHFNDQTWSLFVMNSVGSDVKQITSTQNVWDAMPRWSPDGNNLLFGRTYPNQNFKSEIWIVNADGTDPHCIGIISGNGPYWSKDGGKILYFSSVGSATEIFEMNSDGTGSNQLTNMGSEIYWPKYSPDNSMILFESNDDGDSEIYSMNSDGSKIVQLTHNNTEDGAPEWSPDGKMIVFVSMRDGNYELYVMNTDGSNQIRITNTIQHAIQPDWKPVE